jgi:hypothetical protein
VFKGGDRLRIERTPAGGPVIEVDRVVVDSNLVDTNDASNIGTIISYQREMSAGKFIKRLWTGPVEQTLGNYNWPAEGAFAAVKPIQIFFGGFNNIGELGKLFSVDVYAYPWNANTEEKDVRIDLTNPIYQKLFNYLTILPYSYGINLNETRIKGRININTAPWFVIAQLPWVSSRVGYNQSTLAQAIANYRETIGGYKSIGQLNNVQPGMAYYYLDGQEQSGYPDLSTDPRTKMDGAKDDFEERDLIFARISDLVTVRSDVFTAYILVRLGQNGPQKRVMAILDRSDVRNVNGSIVGSVKIRSLYPVPDPR